MSYSEYKKVQLNDILLKITKGTTPKTMYSEHVEGRVNYFKSECLTDSKYLDTSKVKYIDIETNENLKRSQLMENDILFSMAGMFLGKTSMVTVKDLPANINQAIAIIRVDNELANPEYIYYFLNQDKVLKFVNSSSSQSAQPNINLKQIGEIEVTIPDISIQEKVTSLLRDLDKKIELNNRINKNLEQMAQAIFKQWFVDFEFPNEQGEPYKSSGGKMVWCEELGKEIPEGWEVGPVTELIEVNPKRVLKKGTEAVYVEMKSIPSFEPRIANWIKREVSSGTKFINGDVLLARITPCLENGKTAFVDILPEDEVGWGSTEFIVLRSKNQNALEYAYILARSDEFRDHAIKNMTGSSGRQRVPESCFDNLTLAIPPTSLITNYGIVITPFFKKMKQNGDSNIRLSQLRDAFLPKLMSGEIDVSNIEI